MNHFDEKYEIRLGEYDDIPQIMQFIDEHWKKGHILAVNRSFFEFEFLEKDGTVNFIIAIDKEKKTIESISGFLKASHDPENLDIWGSVLKTVDGNMGMLGLELIKRRPLFTGCRNELGVGDNPKTAIPLFKMLLRRYTNKLNHHYILADRQEYKIAMVCEKQNIEEYIDERYEIIKFENIEELTKRFDLTQFKDCIPYKDKWYINHRFFEHPIYIYEIYGIENDDEVKAIFILRRQEYEGRIAIRFVDYIGDQKVIAGTGYFWKSLFDDERVEYVDFYEGGFDETSLKRAGFALRTDSDLNIIPNYFGPFLQENIDIWVDSTSEDSTFFKADDDQDRPNLIN